MNRDLARGTGLPILTFHGFAPRRSVLATEPGWFESILARLAEAGFHPVDPHDWIVRGCPDEPNGFALTFDDGLASLLDVVDTVSARGVPATVFVVADRVGTTSAWSGRRCEAAERLLGWDELTALQSLGFRIGAHGASHRRLDTCPPRHWESEFRGARERIEDRIGRSCPLLAYPYGLSTPPVRRAAEAWFDAAFGTSLAYASWYQSRFDVARIDAYYLRGESELQALVGDRWRPWLLGRRLLRGVRRGVERLYPDRSDPVWEEAA